MIYYISMLSTTGGKLKVSPSRILINYKKIKSYIKKINFTHPYLNSKNTSLQKDLRLIQGKKRTWFCGSYFGYGFHEDGLKSSIELTNNFKI